MKRFSLIFIACLVLILLVFQNHSKKIDKEESFEYYNYIDNISLNNMSNATISMSRKIDISDITALKNFSTNVFIATVDTIDGCSTTASGDYSPFPSIYGKLTILENLRGEIKNKTISFIRLGGVISMADLEKDAPQELIENREKHRLEAASENIDKENTYVNYMEKDDIQLEAGKTYLFFATYIPKANVYGINGAQYGAREILNVKTNKTVFRTMPEIKNLQVKNNNTNEYESLSNLIQLYFK